MKTIEEILDMVAGKRILVTLSSGNTREYWETSDLRLLTSYEAQNHWKDNSLIKRYFKVLEAENNLLLAQADFENALEMWRENSIYDQDEFSGLNTE